MGKNKEQQQVVQQTWPTPQEIDAFKNYAAWTVKTSVHRTKERALIGSVLGIGGEVNEYINKLYTLSASEQELVSELGDILYYVGHIFYRIGAIDKIRFVSGLTELEVSGYNVVCSIQEHFKKIVRDTEHISLDEYSKRDEFIHLLNKLFSLAWGEIGLVITDHTFHDVLRVNQEKLLSRFKRQVIGGHGDDR